MDKIVQIRRAIGEKTDQLVQQVDNQAAFEALEAEIVVLEGTLSRAISAQQRASLLASPVNGNEHPAVVTNDALDNIRTFSGKRDIRPLFGRGAPVYEDYQGYVRSATNFNPDPQKHFRNLGEQLQAIQQHYASKGTATDPRLVRAPTGAGEVDPTGGGFLVQTDFATTIFMLAHDQGEILGLCNKIPIGANANGLKMLGIDETSRATGSRWGGVQSYWVDEGTTVNQTKPKFRRVEWDLHKLMSLMTVSDELLQDSTALTAIMGQAFSEEMTFMVEDAVVEGDGIGKPLGYLKSPALITVGKESGQVAKTIVFENILNMWSRLWARSRKNAVWLINQDIEPMLYGLSQVVGTGGQPVYMPPGGLSGNMYATLFGRPVIATEFNDTLGQTNDIALVDLSQYTLVDKGGMQAATSMHVAFDTDQMRYRLVYRVDGKSLWHAPVSPFKGSATKSPFIVLGSR